MNENERKYRRSKQFVYFSNSYMFVSLYIAIHRHAGKLHWCLRSVFIYLIQCFRDLFTSARNRSIRTTAESGERFLANTKKTKIAQSSFILQSTTNSCIGHELTFVPILSLRFESWIHLSNRSWPKNFAQPKSFLCEPFSWQVHAVRFRCKIWK